MENTVVERITVNPSQCGGRPCIRGLRIRVSDVLELLAAGESRDKSWLTTPIWKRKTSPLYCCTQRASLTIPY